VRLEFYKKREDQLAFGIVPAFRRYELYYARFHEMRRALEPLQKSLGRPLRILDVGSGIGDAHRFTADLCPGAEWVGIEIDPLRARKCRDLGYAQVVEDVDLERDPLPFPEGRFDVVIASHVLEHLENAKEALADWHRVLAPGGVLLLGVPMHLGFIAALARLRYRLFGRRPRRHCQFFSLRTLRRFLSGYLVRDLWGFRILSARRQLPLEDFEWFYRASLWLGRRFPGLTQEVNVVLEKAPRD